MTADIDQLIQQLEDLHRGELAAEKLVACGERAIAPLRDYLIGGRPSHIYQPRQWAIQALARLGALSVLLEYLSLQQEIPDPVTLFGEEAVQSTAARALAAWKMDEVFEALFRFAAQKSLPGVIEALGSFRRPESIPLLIRALGDDFSRKAAENALRQMGEASRPSLKALAVDPASDPLGEAPSSRMRRKVACAILEDLDRWPAAEGLAPPTDDTSVSE